MDNLQTVSNYGIFFSFLILFFIAASCIWCGILCLCLRTNKSGSKSKTKREKETFKLVPYDDVYKIDSDSMVISICDPNDQAAEKFGINKELANKIEIEYSDMVTDTNKSCCCFGKNNKTMSN